MAVSLRPHFSNRNYTHRILRAAATLFYAQHQDWLARAGRDGLPQETVSSSSSAAAPPPPSDPKIGRIEKPKEKTIFNLKLQSFDAAAKPKIIREVKALIPNLTLIDAKKFVESVPQVLKENMPKEDADKLKEVLEKLGAVVVLE
ncbi:ribosomal protein L7/L12 C-terminal domain-containing protein [Suillus variegatus]|nr:ribosomal protein L7/L12 C-terminal domain-containing protein [Suillus variegatus]